VDFNGCPPTLAELSRQLTPTLPPAVSDRYFADDDRLSLTGMSSRLAGTRPHANQCNPTRILWTCHPPLPQRSRLHINLLPKIVHEDDRSIKAPNNNDFSVEPAAGAIPRSFLR
jgi:hypothetical protein